MKAKQILACGAVGIGAIAAAAFVTKGIVAPAPVSKENVSLVMLGKAVDRVRTAAGRKTDPWQLLCESKGDGNVTCRAIGDTFYRVSFANKAAVPAFELTGKMGMDGKMYVIVFKDVPNAIPAREVDRFISAFDGQPTVVDG